MEPYFNSSLNGVGIEGFFNYTNSLVNGWFANLFLAAIWIISVYVLSKSEWKLSGVLSFSFFLTFLLSIIMKLFMDVGEYVIFILGVGLAASIFWAVIEGK